MILLDTNVLSELVAATPAKSVLDFLDQIDVHHTFTSVISIGEVAFGVARLPDGRRRRGLAEWLGSFEERFMDRVIAPDVDTAHIWGELRARLESTGKSIASADGWIAATAMRHGLRLATRNVRDFQDTGVDLINPWVV